MKHQLFPLDTRVVFTFTCTWWNDCSVHYRVICHFIKCDRWCGWYRYVVMPLSTSWYIFLQILTMDCKNIYFIVFGLFLLALQCVLIQLLSRPGCTANRVHGYLSTLPMSHTRYLSILPVSHIGYLSTLPVSHTRYPFTLPVPHGLHSLRLSVLLQAETVQSRHCCASFR